MKTKVLSETDERTIALIFDAGDECIAGLTRFATDYNITAARFQAIGAFRQATLGYFDLETKDYVKIPVNEQVEVVSLIGDIALDGSKPKVHAHAVLCKRDGSAHGGHLLAGYVRPTLEVLLIASPNHLARKFNPAFGLALIDVGG